MHIHEAQGPAEGWRKCANVCPCKLSLITAAERTQEASPRPAAGLFVAQDRVLLVSCLHVSTKGVNESSSQFFLLT